MIRGIFTSRNEGRRPIIRAQIELPQAGYSQLEAFFVVDTGADATMLGSFEALRLASDFGIDLDALPEGPAVGGVTGVTRARRIDVVLVLGDDRLPLNILIPPPSPACILPCLLGRDALAYYALFMEERSGRVLLLAPDEADQLALP